jgi:hypothetical protein
MINPDLLIQSTYTIISNDNTQGYSVFTMDGHIELSSRLLATLQIFHAFYCISLIAPLDYFRHAF